MLVALNGCSGGGSSNSGDDPENNTTTEGFSVVLEELDGLSGDADNHDLLYFTQSALTGNAGLYSIDPASPDTPVHVDEELESSLLPRENVGPMIHDGNFDRLFLPIHTIAEDEEDGAFSDYRIARVFYGDGKSKFDDSQGYRQVSTAVTSQYDSPVEVSEESSGREFQRAHILYDLNEPDNTAILYSRGGEWWLSRIGDTETVAPTWP